MKIVFGIFLYLCLAFSFSISASAKEPDKKEKQGIITLRNGDLKIHAGELCTIIPVSQGDWGHGIRMEFKIADNGQPILFWVEPLYGGRYNSYSVLIGVHLQF